MRILTLELVRISGETWIFTSFPEINKVLLIANPEFIGIVYEVHEIDKR